MSVYSFNGVDKLNGLFFHLTQSGANLSEIVEVKSGQHVADRPPTNLLDQTNSYWYINSLTTTDHWFSFHFLENHLSLTHYSFRQYYNNENIIKSWIFEGSNDGFTWSQIDEKYT